MECQKSRPHDKNLITSLIPEASKGTEEPGTQIPGKASLPLLLDTHLTPVTNRKLAQGEDYC